MVKKRGKFRSRHVMQAAWALLTNGYLAGFLHGKIYQGPWKKLCVPGLNCYSCPGALGSCPIGALQAVLSSRNFQFAYYVVGFLLLIGALLGRFVCGFLCPFGWIQDLLHKIPFPRKCKTFRGDKLLRKVKYGILLIFVILLPLFLVDILGQGTPWFCKLICPAGMLEGGIPLVLLNQGLRSAIGWLYAWKGVILGCTVLLSIWIYRPFCKYLCPLGAIYSLFNFSAPCRPRKVHPMRRLCESLRHASQPGTNAQSSGVHSLRRMSKYLSLRSDSLRHHALL